VTLLTIDYYIDDDIFWHRQELFRKDVIATLYVDGKSPKTVQKKVSELQNF